MAQLATLSLFLINGCVSLSPGFISVVHDHKKLTSETNMAIIATLQEECNSAANEDEIEACHDLIERLETLIKQSNAIDDYVIQEITEQDLISYWRSAWGLN